MDLVAVSAVAFVAAGFIKGVLGFGFPVVALIFLTLAIGLFDALAIIVVPTIVTNIWQAMSGPHLRDIFRRMWLYFGVAMGGILLALSTTIFGGMGGYLMRVYKSMSLGSRLQDRYDKAARADTTRMRESLQRIEAHLADIPETERPAEDQ